MTCDEVLEAAAITHCANSSHAPPARKQLLHPRPTWTRSSSLCSLHEMSRMFFALAFTAIFACGSKGFIDDYESVVDEYCACKDVACAERMLPKIKALGDKYEGKDRDSLSDSEKTKVDAVSAKMLGCMSARTDAR